MRRYLCVLLTALAAVLPLQAKALCDIGGGRVVHAESVPFNDPGASTAVYWVSHGATAPRWYYTYTTENPLYMGLLTAALASGKQVRVTGNAASCPGSGTLRDAGVVVAVFIDWFN